MRLAHISDVHIGWNYPGPSPEARLLDVNMILHWTAQKMIAEKVDLCLVAGDCFKDARVMLDRASKEIAAIVRFLRTLSEAGIETIVISGTPSHDSRASYELIEQMRIPKVSIRTKPGIIPYVPGVNIACLPGLNRSMLMTQDEYKGMPPEQVHRRMTDKIAQLCMGMAAQMPADKPKILMAHMTYQGADTGFTDLLMQHEPILTKEAVSGFDIVCLGHIHRPQQIDGKVFYSGPIERLSFNDEGITPGFWIHDLGEDWAEENGAHFWYLKNYRFIETPARRYVTLDWNEPEMVGVIDHKEKGWSYFDTIPDIQDAIVRLRYSCTEETAKQLNRKALEQALYDAGCFYCQEIKADVAREDRARDSTIRESLTPIEALNKWCANQGVPEQEIPALQTMTDELMGSI